MCQGVVTVRIRDSQGQLEETVEVSTNDLSLVVPPVHGKIFVFAGKFKGIYTDAEVKSSIVKLLELF